MQYIYHLICITHTPIFVPVVLLWREMWSFVLKKATFDDGIREHGDPHHTKLRPRQCTYNLTLWRVRVTIVALKEQEILDIMNVCLQS